jgi:hypothetical protein
MREALTAFLDGASERLRAINVQPTMTELARRFNFDVSNLVAIHNGRRELTPQMLAAWITAWNEKEPSQATIHKTSAGWKVEWWDPFTHNGRPIGLVGKKTETGFFYVSQREREIWNVSWATYDTWPGAVYLDGRAVKP